MKLIFQGIQRIQGYKKVNGEPFDMAVCYVSVPIESGRFGKDASKQTVITGYGLKPAELEADVHAIAAFEKIPSGFLVDFSTDQRFFAGELKTIITGGRVVNQPAMAAVKTA